MFMYLLTPPLGACDMSQAGANQHQRAVSIREGTDSLGAALDLSIQAFQSIVRADPGPVLTGKTHISQSLFYALLDLLCSCIQFHLTQSICNLGGLFPGRSETFLGMDRLEHHSYFSDLAIRDYREHIAVEMNYTTLVSGFRKYFGDCLQHSEILISYDQANTVYASFFQPYKETSTAFAVFFRTLSCT